MGRNEKKGIFLVTSGERQYYIAVSFLMRQNFTWRYENTTGPLELYKLTGTNGKGRVYWETLRVVEVKKSAQDRNSHTEKNNAKITNVVMELHHININQLDKIVNFSHSTARSLPSFICVAFVLSTSYCRSCQVSSSLSSITRSQI